MTVRFIHLFWIPLVMIASSGAMLATAWARAKRARRLQTLESLIEFECPACRKLTLVDDQLVGRMGKCTACGEIFPIPAKPAPIRLLPRETPPLLAKTAGAVSEVLRLDGPYMDTILGVLTLSIGVFGLISGLGLFVYLAHLEWSQQSTDSSYRF